MLRPGRPPRSGKTGAGPRKSGASNLIGSAVGEEEATLSPAQKRWFRIAAVLVGLIVVAIAVVTTKVLTSSGAKQGAKGGASASASVSASSIMPIEPGEYARPTLTGTNVYDPWKGAKPIDGLNPDTIKTTLSGSSWAMEFSSRPLLNGSRMSATSGDTNRKDRRLDAIIEASSDNQVYLVMCQAGGTGVLATEETSLKYVPECLNAAVTGDNWISLKSWLDQNLKSLAENGGNATYQLSGFKVYAESNKHVISCAITNS